MSITEKSCGAVIYHVNTADEYEFLLIQSRSDGHWGFPKGHMENSENEKETAIREIKEEVGLSVSFVEGFNETMAYDLSNGNHKQVTYFLAEAETINVVLQEEVSAYKWLVSESAENQLTFDDEKALFNKAVQSLRRESRDEILHYKIFLMRKKTGFLSSRIRLHKNIKYLIM